jgi:tape measure domain-containing protein
MGLSMDQQKGIYKAFSDMLAKGTVNAEELDLLAPFHSDMIGLAA